MGTGTRGHSVIFNAENAVGCGNVFLMLAMKTLPSRTRLVLSGIRLERSPGSAFRRGALGVQALGVQAM